MYKVNNKNAVIVAIIGMLLPDKKNNIFMKSRIMNVLKKWFNDQVAALRNKDFFGNSFFSFFSTVDI